MGKRDKTNSCRTACKMCALCDGRNYEQCYDACRKCDSCVGNYNPYYASPHYSRLHRYSFTSDTSPVYGKISMGGRYYNPYIPEYSDCEGSCGYSVCRAYKDRMRQYDNCLQNHSKRYCNKKYGCKNWKGFEMKNTPPINPKYTGCQPCWTSGSLSYFTT